MGGWGTSTSTTDAPFIPAGNYADTTAAAAPTTTTTNNTTTTINNNNNGTNNNNNSTYSCEPSLNNWSCCNNSTPCGLGQGDCDYDSDCAGNLVCGYDNCAAGSPSLDCCVAPVSNTTTNNNNTATCDPTMNDWSCCTVSAPCGVGLGDCDGDNDCAGDLVCGLNNCAAGDSGLDCCMVAPTTTTTTLGLWTGQWTEQSMAPNTITTTKAITENSSGSSSSFSHSSCGSSSSSSSSCSSSSSSSSSSNTTSTSTT